MDYFEVKSFFEQLYPGKSIDLSFDDSCIRQVEIIHTDGLPNLIHHVEYRKVKVSVEGLDATYVSILPHRMNCCWKDIQKALSNIKDVYINPEELSLETQELEKMSGLSIEEIQKRKSIK